MAPPLRRIRRLAIVNRGEAAMRAIHAVRELNAERDEPIRVVALYTDVERRAMFVREADEAVLVGPATFVDEADGARKSGYLDLDALERALVSSGADAAWVGWGFVSEQPAFVELCERLGITFVGPDAATMRRLGDKISSKLLAEEARIPVALWSGGPVDTPEAARAAAERIGFPLLIKATAGGGGRGIRRVDDASDLTEALDRARAEASVAFGDDTVFLERLVSPARHVEVQVIADGAGTAWAVGVRDCSLQRRNQKVLEESSCPVFSAEQDRELRDAAVRLVRFAGYCGAGTVEFLYSPVDGSVSFMEVNARLQVEHPVTEVTTGVDLVKLQLHVAEGGRLEGPVPPTAGHALEVRLNAEDPARDFLPAPGTIELLRLPTGPGVRVDTGVAEGDVIPSDFDSMIAKVIAWGRDRDEALARLRRALADTIVVVRNGTTNQGFLLDLLDRHDLRTGAVDNTWLDREQAAAGFVPTQHAELALVLAAVEVAADLDDVEQTRFYGWARRGRPRVDVELGHAVELRQGSNTYRPQVWRLGPTRWRVVVDGITVELDVERIGRFERRVGLAGDLRRVVASEQRGDLLVDVDGVTHRISRDDGGLVRTPAPAVVVALTVQAGDEVAVGDAVAVVESMKMETVLRAPFAGRVRAVLTGTNVQVDAGTPLVQLDAGAEVDGTVAVERLRFDGLASDTAPDPTPEGRCAANQQLLRWLLLGYDVPDDDARAIASTEADLCAHLAAQDPSLVSSEHDLLRLYGDLRSLTRPSEAADTPATADAGPGEYLSAFTRSLDAEAEGLPPRYVDLLRRVLEPYGARDLARGPELDEGMYRVLRSIARVDTQRAAVLTLLTRRLEHAAELVAHVGGEFREVLDHLVAATRARDPAVADLAWEVRHRYYDQPLAEATRATTYAAMDAHLDALRVDPDGSSREMHVDALVACPRPLAPMLTERIIAARSPAERWVLLETMTRRYYRMRPLGAFAVEMVDGVELLGSSYEHEGRPVRVVVTFADLAEPDDLATVVAALATAAQDGEPDGVVLADVYASRPAEPDDDALAAQLQGAIEAVALPPGLRRIVVAASRHNGMRGMSAVDLFTFRPSDEGGVVEDLELRCLHPMMADRLYLWRYANFALRRLPAEEDLYLYHGVARDNPNDERLFAIAEVRDLTPIHDHRGRVVALPELEHVFDTALAAVRRFQSSRPPSRRLQWNRVALHVWPPIDLADDEMREIVTRLTRATVGLGIEMTVVRGRFPHGPGGEWRDEMMRVSSPAGSGLLMEFDDPPTDPLRTLDEYTQKVVSARRRGTVYPYELVQTLAPAAGEPGLPRGRFVEHDLDDHGRLVPVDRPRGRNDAGIVAGVVRTFTDRYPEGMTRVALFGDPTKALGSIAEPECRRIIAGLDLAEELRVPIEWFALSAGAKIAMDSGTENMDWVAAVLRRLIEFTQRGGEVNVVVAGINVGAQPYWNAEATMLMHTRGILVMTPESAMVLTGKQALDYSGGVSAEDNLGIGGYERIMGPNGQAQYWAPDLERACRVLIAHYEHAYVAPGERFPRRAATTDPIDRDVRGFGHHVDGSEFATVGDVFSSETNPERKKAFDIRTLMRATADQDHATLERWSAMRDAATAVVWDAHLGGWPVTLVGIESRPLARHGPVPADGPDQWTSGTLFPFSSKKVARAVNATSGTRPLVVLANLSGFDGSPESLRNRQLEFGAEIGRAVVNFDGPIVFCVVSRYHGGAFVVFSKRLNDELEAAAVEGSRASVIGGAPAAAVVFTHEVDVRTREDLRIVELEARMAEVDGAERERLRAELAVLRPQVRSEKLGELAAEFDAVHSVERAERVGSIDAIIPAPTLRPYLVEALDRGIARTLDRLGRRGGADGDGPDDDRPDERGS